MDGIFSTLRNLSLAQMVLAWLFVACYALAVGGMLGAKGSLRAGLLALMSALAFAGLSDDWVHGALLMVFAVGGMGLFVVASWTLATGSAWLLRRGDRLPVPQADPQPAETPASPYAAGVWRALRRLRLVAE